MTAIHFKETPIRHASDFIYWYEASGHSDASFRPRVDTRFTLLLTDSPTDLRIVDGVGKTFFARKNLHGARITVQGRAHRSDMVPPAEPAYTVAGHVSDARGKYNPRVFQISAGNATGHDLAVYRSPFGTQLLQGGGVRTSIVYDTGDPASWALLSLIVTPPLGEPLNFIAQADIHGDVILPLNRLPAISNASPSSTYSASLSVRADGNSGASISNPDTCVNYLVGSSSAAASFNPSTNVSVTPGALVTITTNGEQQLIIQST